MKTLSKATSMIRDSLRVLVSIGFGGKNKAPNYIRCNELSQSVDSRSFLAQILMTKDSISFDDLAENFTQGEAFLACQSLVFFKSCIESKENIEHLKLEQPGFEIPETGEIDEMFNYCLRTAFGQLDNCMRETLREQMDGNTLFSMKSFANKKIHPRSFGFSRIDIKAS